MGDASHRRPGLQVLLSLALALCAGAVYALMASGAEDSARRGANEAFEAGADRRSDDESSEVGPVGAIIEGRVLLELRPEVPQPTAATVAVNPPDIAETESSPDAGGDAAAGTPAEVAWEDLPDVKTRPAEEGTCMVAAWQKGVRKSEPVSCNAAGDYRLELASGTSGPVAIEVEVPGRLRAVLEVETPPGGRGRVPTVALGFGESLQGQVVDARGDPVPNVVVEAMPSPHLGEPEPWRRTTDHSGAYTFDTLPPGPVALRCAADGYAPTVVEAIAPEDGVVLRMGALFTLRGRVLLGAAKPSKIQVRLEGSGVWPAKAIDTEPDGSFAIPAIPDGVYAVEAVALGDGPQGIAYASVPLENVTPELEVTLALARAYTVEVQVVDGSGMPIEGARTRMLSSQVGLLAKTARSDAQGKATLGPAVVGPYVIHADADGFLPTDPLPVTIEEGAELTVTVQLAKSARIEGLVVDDSGHPVEGATVAVDTDVLFTVGEGAARAQMFSGPLVAAGTLGVTRGPVPEIPLGTAVGAGGPSDVRTSSSGRFVLSGLTPGRYRLQALHGAFAASDEVVVAVGSGVAQSGVRLVLRRGVPLTGRVRDGNDRPILGAVVRLGDGSSYRTNARGVFDAGRRRGRQSLVASAAGYAPVRRTVTVGNVAVDVELSLVDSDAGLSGRVENDNGQPIEGARITVQASDGLSATRIAWSDARGLWTLGGLAQGIADVDVSASGFLSADHRVRVRNGEDAVLDTTLGQGWTAELSLRAYGTDDPVVGASVSGGGLHGISDREGLVRIEGLGPDRVKFTVRATSFPPRSVSVSRPKGGVAEQEVILVDGGSLAGTVTDYRGDSVAGALVILRDAAGDERRTRSGPGGAYQFEGIPEGEVEIEAFPPRAREDELAEVAQDSDVLRGRVTKGVVVRFDRR